MNINKKEEDSALRECPFCGAVPYAELYELMIHNDKVKARYKIGCVRCGVSISGGSLWEAQGDRMICINKGYGELVDRWNRRYPYSETKIN